MAFAHGGSGYIVLRGVLDDFVGNHSGIANAYDQRTTQDCCGDVVFALAMKETSQIVVTQAVC